MASSISSTRAAPTEVVREQASPLTPTSIVLGCSRAGHQNHRPSSPAAEGSKGCHDGSVTRMPIAQGIPVLHNIPIAAKPRATGSCNGLPVAHRAGVPHHPGIAGQHRQARSAGRIDGRAQGFTVSREAVRHRRPARRRVRRPLVRWPWTARRCPKRAELLGGVIDIGPSEGGGRCAPTFR